MAYLEQQNIPTYDLRYPYDCIRVIAGTLLGEPRLKFEPIELNQYLNTYIAKRPNDSKEVFRVDASYFSGLDESDVIFGENLSSAIESYLTFGDYGKLFYLTGKIILQQLSALIIGIPKFTEAKIVSSQFELLRYQIKQTVQFTLEDVINTGGMINEDGTTKNEYDYMKCPVETLNRLDRYQQQLIQETDFWFDIYTAMELLSEGLKYILLGSIINFAKLSDIPLDLIFTIDEAVSKLNVKRLSDAVIRNSSIEVLSKQRFITISILYKKMISFYEYYGGQKINNVVNSALVNLGIEYEAIDPDELSEFVDTTILNQSDLQDYSITLEALLDTQSFITSPSSYEASCLKHDDFNKFIFAQVFFSNNYRSPYIDRSLDRGDNEIVNPKLDHPLKIVFEDGLSNTKYDMDGIVVSLFDYINSLIINIPNEIDNLYYHKVVLVGASLRHIFNKVQYSKEVKEYLMAGIMLSDGAITYLFHEWFKNNKLYQVNSSVHCTDPTALKISKFAEVRCEFDAFNYVTFCINLQGHQDHIDNYIDYMGVATRTISEGYIDGDHTNKNTHTEDNSGKLLRGNDDYMPFLSNKEKLKDLINDVPKEIIELLNYGQPLENLIKTGLKYNLLYQNKLPSYVIYSHYGFDSFTSGLMIIKKRLEDNKLRDEALEVLEELDETEGESSIPIGSDNRLALMLSVNIDKIFNGQITDNKVINFLVTILMKDIIPIGIIRENFSKQLETPKSFDIDPISEQKNFTYSELFPEIARNNQFTFLR